MAKPSKHELAVSRRRTYPCPSRATWPHRADWCASHDRCLDLAIAEGWQRMACPRVCPGYARMMDDAIRGEVVRLYRIGESLAVSHVPGKSGLRG